MLVVHLYFSRYSVNLENCLVILSLFAALWLFLFLVRNGDHFDCLVVLFLFGISHLEHYLQLTVDPRKLIEVMLQF